MRLTARRAIAKITEGTAGCSRQQNGAYGAMRHMRRRAIAEEIEGMAGSIIKASCS